MTKQLLQVKGVKKVYHNRFVINQLSLTIYKKEILAIIGQNGAGKSTLVELILGLRKQDAGDIVYLDDHFRKHVGVQLQSTPFFPGLTVLENLLTFSALYKKKQTKHEALELLNSCGLKEVMHTEASKLSGGQQKRLAIAISFVHQPKIIFLDEPTSALDTIAKSEIHELIRQLNQNGITIVFTSHDLDEVQKLSDRIIMIDEGKIVAEGCADDIRERYQVKNLDELYLKLTKGDPK